MLDYIIAKTSNKIYISYIRADVVLQTWANSATDDEVLGMVVRTGEPCMSRCYLCCCSGTTGLSLTCQKSFIMLCTLK